jgi:hypothetical protein
MIDTNSSLFKVFALIGFLTVLLVVIYLMKKGADKSQAQKSNKAYPPNEYMRQVGKYCPDYWTQVGTDKDGNYRCKNTFNIPVRNDDKCYNGNPQDNENKVKTFDSISEWPIVNVPEGNVDQTLDKRCKWLSNCGSAPNLKASWIGVSDKCKM